MGIFRKNTLQTLSSIEIDPANTALPTDQFVNDRQEVTFDSALRDALMPSNVTRSDFIYENRQSEYDSLRSQLPAAVLTDTPDFIHHHGKDFEADVDTTLIVSEGFGYSPKHNMWREEFIDEATSIGRTGELVTLAARGGGEKRVSVRNRTLGLLAVGGGKLELRIGGPTIVRSIRTSHMGTPDLLVNTDNPAEVRHGIALIYLGGGGYKIIPESGEKARPIDPHTKIPQLRR